MSASLVGSEMCIRDSPNALRNHIGPCVMPSRGPEEGGLLSSGGNSGSVSYTHLTLPTICSV
eukprot:3809214-Alexandrium_andersonii.AAC.1